MLENQKDIPEDVTVGEINVYYANDVNNFLKGIQLLDKQGNEIIRIGNLVNSSNNYKLNDDTFIVGGRAEKNKGCIINFDFKLMTVSNNV